MDSRIILTTILSLSFGIYSVDLAMIFVKLTLEVFRSIVTLYSLDLLGIFGSQENFNHNGIASEIVMVIMTTAVVFAVLPFYSFLRVWQKCLHFRVFKCPVFQDLTRVVTLITIIFLLGILNVEFGSSMVSKLFLMMLAIIFVYGCCLATGTIQTHYFSISKSSKRQFSHCYGTDFA